MSATVLSFGPPRAPTRFTVAERNGITAAAMWKPGWGAIVHQDDTDTDVASIGPYAGGDEDAEDVFGITITPGGFELAVLKARDAVGSYKTLEEALAAMRILAGP